MRKFSLLILALTVGFVALADNPTTPPPPPTSGIPVPINPDPFNLTINLIQIKILPYEKVFAYFDGGMFGPCRL